MTPTVPLLTPAPTPTMSGSPALMSAEEFFRKHENHRVELVEGVVKELPMPGSDHGYIVAEICGYLRDHVKKHAVGRVMTADTFIRIPGDPQTVRGADVCFLSYAKWPKEQKLPQGVLEVAPELVVEVRSPTDSWTEVFQKVSDYHRAGVIAVVVVNPMRQAVGVFRDSPDDDHFSVEQELVIPDVLPGFAVPVRKFFE